MYDILKASCVTHSLEFIYARKDFANLTDELETGQTYVILDPVQISENFGEYNELESRDYSGSFMVLVSSDIDKGDYDQRYTDQIKPILEGALASIIEDMRCNGLISFSSWRTIEAINVFDYNLDGIVVTYQIKENV